MKRIRNVLVLSLTAVTLVAASMAVMAGEEDRAWVRTSLGMSN